MPPEPPLTCAVRAFVALARGETRANPSGIELGVAVVRVLARAAANLARVDCYTAPRRRLG